MATERLNDLSHVLWREREALELLLFKLEEERLLLADGQSRWLGHASHEVDTVLDRVAELELARALGTATAARDLGLGENAILARVAAAAPSPWPSVIDKHLLALRRMAKDVLKLADGNRRMLNVGLGEVRQAMTSRPRRPSTSLLFDAARFEAALGTNERVLPPSLVDVITD